VTLYPSTVTEGTSRYIYVISPYVLLQGLELLGSRKSGIHITSETGGFVTVRGCAIHDVFLVPQDNAQGIFIEGGKEIVVQDCHIYDIFNVHSANSMTLCKTIDSLFEDNHNHDIHADNGINDKDGGHGNEHRGNVSYDCDQTGIMIMGQAEHHDVQVHDNLIYGCRDGIGVGLHESGVYGTRVHHNTVLDSLNLQFAQSTTVWNCVFQSGGKLACTVEGKFNVQGVGLKLEKAEDTVFLARRTVFSASDPAAFIFGDRAKTNPVGLDTFARATHSSELLCTKVEFENAEKHDYRIKLTPELRKLAGDGDYLGAHESVLKLAAAGCPMRSRDNAAKRISDGKK